MLALCGHSKIDPIGRDLPPKHLHYRGASKRGGSVERKDDQAECQRDAGRDQAEAHRVSSQPSQLTRRLSGAGARRQVARRDASPASGVTRAGGCCSRQSGTCPYARKTHLTRTSNSVESFPPRVSSTRNTKPRLGLSSLSGRNQNWPVSGSRPASTRLVPPRSCQSTLITR